VLRIGADPRPGLIGPLGNRGDLVVAQEAELDIS